MAAREPDRIVIVGGGVSATRCAFELRACGYGGDLVVLAAERHAPYDRTLLSKELLLGGVELEDILLQTPADYQEHGIELRLCARALALDAAGRRVVLADGSGLRYDRLIVATGGKATRPPALRHPAALCLRELDDGRVLAAALARGGRLAVVGGGFVGAEVAAAARSAGLEVTLVEALEAPLARALGGDVGARVAQLHRAHGVDVLTHAPVAALRSAGRRVELVLADGRSLQADSALVGTGMAPATGWLEGSGLELDGGVVTDALCRTNAPGVLAAGDCARWWNPRYGELMRVEHWDTARRHGTAAAHAALGDGQPFAPVPYFWSFQHGVRFQWIGRPAGWDSVEIEEDGAPWRFVARYTRAGRLLAVLAAGAPRAIVQARDELEAAEEVMT